MASWFGSMMWDVKYAESRWWLVLAVLADLVLLILIMTCLITDLRERKIYNKVVFPAVAAGIVLNTAQLGLPGLRTSIAGFITGILIFLVPFALGGLGAGDVKLLGAVGALKGPLFAVYAALAAALIGGVLALLVLLWQCKLLSTLKRLGMAMFILLRGGGGSMAQLLLERTPYSSLIPYGLPIFLGTIAAYLYSFC
ncbi:MAG: A24 family peptidase [Thermacetogeniaceae bacterium]|jgi:prepilin peptidase CpaA|nr:A24 family peptidase [Thermoanaerobacterales bacterium]NLN21685.1 prepilin peptidase [Syntrophomonadaceae bacterium]HAF17584.1 prepilin peptidase [Peptococcaceae bacterium]